MNREEIIEMAREAGLAVKPPYWGYTEQYHFAGFEQTFEQFVACVEERAAAAEREACAKVASERQHWPMPRFTHAPSERTMGRIDGEKEMSRQIAAAIRARGNK